MLFISNISRVSYLQLIILSSVLFRYHEEFSIVFYDRKIQEYNIEHESFKGKFDSNIGMKLPTRLTIGQ